MLHSVQHCTHRMSTPPSSSLSSWPTYHQFPNERSPFVQSVCAAASPEQDRKKRESGQQQQHTPAAAAAAAVWLAHRKRQMESVVKCDLFACGVQRIAVISDILGKQGFPFLLASSSFRRGGHLLLLCLAPTCVLCS